MSIAPHPHIDGPVISPVLPGQPPAEIRPLHRLREVRQSERVSRRAMARRLHTDIQSITLQEQESADLPRTTLYQWQAALGVPVSELLVEVGPELSPPVLRRSQMLRVMKTASSILEQTKQIGVRRMAENLIEQLTEIMPELKGVGGWPSVGQRRSLSELGQAAQRFFPSSRYPNLEEY
jgi:transcriptional regulator with XRE-family HTH domain